jgi:tripartite-type tricarboxylate transporter receptor subunit TctC
VNDEDTANRTRWRVTAALVWMSLFASPLIAAGAEQYPAKPVRMIIPFAAGGATDTVVRIVATRLPGTLGEQVVIDNRTGAGGLIGTEIASQANPDGYTLLATGTPHVIVPHLYKKISYDALRDFEPIMQIGSQPYALTVHPSLGVTSVKELIALAKKQPGRINYASSGNGGAQHLFAAMFVSMAHIDMVHVPYKGSGLARADLLGGQVKVGCLGVSSIINQHKAGQLRIIAVTSAKRSPELPDIPTIAETLPGYDASLWTGLFAPRGTPATVIKRIHADAAKLLQTADVKKAFDRVGTYVEIKGPAEFREYVKSEYAKWGKVVRDVHLQIN